MWLWVDDGANIYGVVADGGGVCTLDIFIKISPVSRHLRTPNFHVGHVNIRGKGKEPNIGFVYTVDLVFV